MAEEMINKVINPYKIQYITYLNGKLQIKRWKVRSLYRNHIYKLPEENFIEDMEAVDRKTDDNVLIDITKFTWGGEGSWLSIDFMYEILGCTTGTADLLMYVKNMHDHVTIRGIRVVEGEVKEMQPNVIFEDFE